MKNEMFIENGTNLTQENSPHAANAVLLIGDSIRIGYCDTVRNALADQAEVFFPNENCRHTHHVITMLRTWATMCPPERTKVVLFNCGHWDAAHWGGDTQSLTTLSCYAENIGRIYDTLKSIYPDAAIVFATTTPMNPDGSNGANPRTNQEISQYNKAAVVTLRSRNGHIIDLFEQTKDWSEDAYQDYCHFTPEAFSRLGTLIAEEIRQLL